MPSRTRRASERGPFSLPLSLSLSLAVLPVLSEGNTQTRDPRHTAWIQRRTPARLFNEVRNSGRVSVVHLAGGRAPSPKRTWSAGDASGAKRGRGEAVREAGGERDCTPSMRPLLWAASAWSLAVLASRMRPNRRPCRDQGSAWRRHLPPADSALATDAVARIRRAPSSSATRPPWARATGGALACLGWGVRRWIETPWPAMQQGRCSRRATHRPWDARRAQQRPKIWHKLNKGL